MLKLKTGDWVLVADGSRAIVLENEGTAMEPQLRVIQQFGQDNPKTSAQGRDKPSRTFESTGARRSAMETPDLHQRAEDRFVVDVMHEVEKAAAAAECKNIVIAAPPVALGEMRKHAGNGMKERISAWIDKDLTKEPIPAITKAIVRALEN